MAAVNEGPCRPYLTMSCTSGGPSRANSSSSLQEQLSPRQPAAKRTMDDRTASASGVDPAILVRDTVVWIRHTLGLEVLKKSVMDITIKRTILEKLDTLSSASASLISEQEANRARLEESRIGMGDAVDRFSQILANKEATIVSLTSQLQDKAKEMAHIPPSPDVNLNFAGAVKRVGRSKTRGKERVEAARSKSRLQKRTKVLKESRAKSPVDTFIFTPTDDLNIQQGKEEIWNLVSRATKTPKFSSINARNGNLVIKPHDKKSTDVLRSIARSKGIIKADTIKWPRISIEPVDASLSAKDISERLIEQNPDVLIEATPLDIIPVFKKGPRERPFTRWICEVNPKMCSKVLSANIYLGFDRCRIQRFEDVTQCYKCLRHGHPAYKCFEKDQFCAHCSKRGHIKSACPLAGSDPTCANCRGKHMATDRTCSARTMALANIARRTDYGDICPMEVTATSQALDRPQLAATSTHDG